MKKGSKHTEESKQKNSNSHMGIKFTKEHRIKISIANKGKKKPPFTEEHLKNMSIARKGVMMGKRQFNWKGDDVSYRTLHAWVSRYLGKPNICEECGKKGTGHKMHWANSDGRYERNLYSWKRLCVKCHKRFDSKIKQNV